jgi:hypothetical protein
VLDDLDLDLVGVAPARALERAHLGLRSGRRGGVDAAVDPLDLEDAPARDRPLPVEVRGGGGEGEGEGGGGEDGRGLGVHFLLLWVR